MASLARAAKGGAALISIAFACVPSASCQDAVSNSTSGTGGAPTSTSSQATNATGGPTTTGTPATTGTGSPTSATGTTSSAVTSSAVTSSATSSGSSMTTGASSTSSTSSSSNASSGSGIACPNPTGGTLYVDLTNGNDTTCTGASGAMCACKTIAKAIAILGGGPGTIEVGGAQTIDTLEPVPLIVPPNVIVEGTPTIATIQLPLAPGTSTLAGIIFNNSGASFRNLKIDNQLGSIPALAIVAMAANPLSASLANVEITGSGGGHDCLVLAGYGIAKISASNFHGCGANGMTVREMAQATVDGSIGSTLFNGNQGHGIGVVNGGHVTLNGTAGAPPRITLDLNSADGINAALGTTSKINFIEANSNKGSGVHTFGGATLSMYNSAALYNNVAGVRIDPSSTSLSVAGLDFGVSLSGRNTLQDNNQVQPIGICLLFTPAAGQLNAQGNRFGSNDCSLTTMTQVLTACSGGAGAANPCACSNNSHMDILDPSGVGSHIDVSHCLP